MAKSAEMNLETAWNSVALEERLDLLAEAQASGVVGCFAAAFLVVTVAYAFNTTELLWGGLAVIPFVFPHCAESKWQKAKPALVLRYLAARSIARRYAYGCRFNDITVVMNYPAKMREISGMDKISPYDNSVDYSEKDVWVCLLKGGIVVVSERPGGAKLEFVAPMSPELIIRDATPEESTSSSGLVIEGTGQSKGRSIVLSSHCSGSHYIFRKQAESLVAQIRRVIERLNSLKDSIAEDKVRKATRK